MSAIMFRVSCMSMLFCGLFWTAYATPPSVSRCLDLLTESAMAGDLTSAEQEQLANLTTTLREHHVQRRTVPHHHGTPLGDITSTPVALQGVPELLQLLRVVASLPGELLTSMLNMTPPVHASHQPHSHVGRHDLGNLSLPSIHQLLQLNSSSEGGQGFPASLFNVTSAGEAARQAALLSERLLLSPVLSLLALTRHPGHTRTLPPYLTPDYVLRHMTHLSQYLRTGRETSAPSVQEAVGNSTTTTREDAEVPTTTEGSPEQVAAE